MILLHNYKFKEKSLDVAKFRMTLRKLFWCVKLMLLKIFLIPVAVVDCLRRLNSISYRADI